MPTFGLAYLVNQKHIPARPGFAGTMIVGILQVFFAPAGARVRQGRSPQGVRRGCIAFAPLVWPTFLLYGTGNMWLIWVGMIIGFVVPGVAMQATLQTMLREMFDPEARTTGVNIGYQISNTLGGGLAPFIATALVAAASGAIWPSSSTPPSSASSA